MPVPPTISIIDDDESVCRVLASLLRSLGYESRTFVSAEAFLASAEAGDCACIITDIHMPGMSGIELTELLAARERPVPVIMITARSDPGLEERALSSGAVCLIKKPFEAADLVNCVNRALHR